MFLGVAKGLGFGSICRHQKLAPEPAGVCIPCPPSPGPLAVPTPGVSSRSQDSDPGNTQAALLAPDPQSSSPTWWPGLNGMLGLFGLCSVWRLEGERLDPQPWAAPVSNVFPQSIFEREVVLPPGCADINPLANNKWINNNKV